MSSLILADSQAIVFRSFLPWFLIKNVLLLGSGANFMILAFSTDDSYWWGGVIGTLVLAMYQALGFANQAVIINGGHLILRTGYWSERERCIKAWDHRLEIHQSLVGKLFDYGTVYYNDRDQMCRIEMVASIRAFRYIVAQRRSLSFRLLAQNDYNSMYE